MTLVMVFTVSCSKGSGDESKEKKDSTETKAANTEGQNKNVNSTTDIDKEAVFASVQQLVANVQQLSENDDEALLEETTEIYIQLYPIIHNASPEFKAEVEAIMEPINNESYAPVLEKIMQKKAELEG